MRHRSLVAVVLFVVAAFVACGDDDDDVGDGTTSTTTTAPTPSSTTAAPPSTTASVVLDETGLAVGEQALPFGTEEETVVDAVALTLGDFERGENAECGAGPVTFAQFGTDLLLLVFQEAELVGWSTRSDSLRTDGDIGVGSTKADLEVVYGPVELQESTIGLEFLVADSLGGIVDADAPDGVITNLWAGVTCFAR